MDKFTKEERSNIMRAIKSKDTTEELMLAKALWHKGLRYRKNNKSVFGRPDITFKRYKIAIFVDGEFFHGYNWEERKFRIKSNQDYWIPKIERNIQRDKEVNEFLIQSGWIVIRFWGNFIKKNLKACVSVIEDEVVKAKIAFLK
ncbi:restriction endonuclease HpaII [Flavobacterium rivuli WB 3.3-2 = DSM 21788]|uniref:Very short patch repair endonuclease n=1 Tax=Flavobacterium rivuli WB 3.3-2 = DSM 21788 TaxID=1121895 RepID=A0A0A2M012_9FLAO|nr:very short patch repair endonuclease [Flavobacterium rivuli]KGO85977.1 restriction endonuclease HpaII [Flavobacterium rivuli WB 3.3-2 = DSM 21788]